MARETCPLPFLLALVALPDHKLNVLQEHLAKRSHRLGVLVDVQRDEQDQLLFDGRQGKGDGENNGLLHARVSTNFCRPPKKRRKVATRRDSRQRP
jgi:hypothetical protein